MALSEIQHRHVSQLLTEYCEARVPPTVRDQVRLGFRVLDHAVVLLESRPSIQSPHDWVDLDIAKFRYVKSTGTWKLSCKFRDDRWRAYKPLPEAATFEELLREVEEDPTCIFLGITRLREQPVT